MSSLNREKLFHLQLWMEIIGVITDITTDEHYLYMKVDDKVLPFRKNSKESLNIQDKSCDLIGKTVAVIKTDIPDRPIFVRILS